MTMTDNIFYICSGQAQEQKVWWKQRAEWFDTWWDSYKDSPFWFFVDN